MLINAAWYKRCVCQGVLPALWRIERWQEKSLSQGAYQPEAVRPAGSLDDDSPEVPVRFRGVRQRPRRYDARIPGAERRGQELSISCVVYAACKRSRIRQIVPAPQ